MESELSSDCGDTPIKGHTTSTVSSRLRGCSRPLPAPRSVYRVRNNEECRERLLTILLESPFPRPRLFPQNICCGRTYVPWPSPLFPDLQGLVLTQMCLGLRGWITVALIPTEIPLPFSDAHFSVLPGSEQTTGLDPHQGPRRESVLTVCRS